MTGPHDSSLTATAITSRKGQRKKRAMADKATSMILFMTEPLMRIARARGRRLPLATAFSYRPFRSVSGRTGVKISDGAGREDVRATEFLNSTLHWRTARPAKETRWQKAR